MSAWRSGSLTIFLLIASVVVFATSYQNLVGVNANWIRASQDSSTWLKPGQAMWVLITAPAALRP